MRSQNEVLILGAWGFPQQAILRPGSTRTLLARWKIREKVMDGIL